MKRRIFAYYLIKEQPPGEANPPDGRVLFYVCLKGKLRIAYLPAAPISTPHACFGRESNPSSEVTMS